MQYRTSFVQDAFIQASGLKSSTNTVPAAWEIRGDFGPEEIVRAVQLVVEGHESLRTRIVQRGRSYLQHVSDGGGVDPFIKPVNLTRSDAEAGMSELMGRLLAHQFDLTSPPLWRGFLAKIGRGRWVLGIAFAHVIVDGASVAVFSRDLANALATGSRPKPRQFGPFANAEREMVAAEIKKRYWRDRYQRRTGLETEWNGAANYRVESVPAFEARTVDALRRLAQSAAGGSLSTMFAAVTALAAAAVLDRANPMLGFTTAQRKEEVNGSVFGPLHDHLPVLGGGAPATLPFTEFVNVLRDRRITAREHRLPCGILERIADSTPYDVAMNFAPFAAPAPHRVGRRGTVTARPIPTIGNVIVHRATSVAPVLAAILRPNADGSVTGDITAISALHSNKVVRELAAAVGAVAGRAVSNPDARIGQLA